MGLEAKIEALLFYKGEAVSIKKLSEYLEESEEKIKEALQSLERNLEGRGLRLLIKDEEVTLGTAPEISEVIEKIAKEEISKELGKAALETLTIIIYEGPISRPSIDYIRGVNSSFILRNLMVRGLVERTGHPTDSRSFLYRPTFELLRYLGVSRVEEMPEYDLVKAKIAEFVKEENNGEKEKGEGE